MGLFINKKHENLFKSDKQIEEINQTVYRSDTLSEAIEEQKKAFDLMNVQYSELEKKLARQRRMQSDRWKSTKMRFAELMESNEARYRFEDDAVQTMKRLDKRNEELQKTLMEKVALHEALSAKIDVVNESNAEIALRLERFEEEQKELLSKMDLSMRKQEKMVESLEAYKNSQETIAERVEQQEGLIDKLLRQMDFLRATLFERTHFIAEKIDKSYQLTSSYFRHGKDKTDLPKTK